MKTPVVSKGNSEHKPLPAVIHDENHVPDFMRADIGHGLGLEALDGSDMALPRLLLMQGLSKEKEQFDFLKSGDFFHTAHEIILPQPILAVPILIDKRYLLWRPRDMGGGILARANDGKTWIPANQTFNVKLDKKDGGANVTWHTAETVDGSGLAEWGTMNPNDPDSPPAATLTYNILLAFPANPELSPAVLSLARTGIKPAQKLNMKLKALNRPSFHSVIRLSSFLDHSGTNDFYSIATEQAGFLCGTRKWRADDAEAWTLGDEALYLNYKALYEQLKRTGLDIKDEDSLQNDGIDALSPEGAPKF
jgi:hypothetical protein